MHTLVGQINYIDSYNRIHVNYIYTKQNADGSMKDFHNTKLILGGQDNKIDGKSPLCKTGFVITPIVDMKCFNIKGKGCSSSDLRGAFCIFEVDFKTYDFGGQLPKKGWCIKVHSVTELPLDKLI